ncbi:MAG: gephyrin-like molybdotransferase Glp [Bacillota bacterium]|nr:molybdopterin molybdotransferase MoeA [Clostridia bacterium]
MSELFQVVTLDQGRSLITNQWKLPQRIERVKISEGLNRRLAVDLVAKEPVPGFDRSVVDGYAVRAADTFGASESLPALFKVVGEVAMGDQPDIILQANEAVAIATGGMLPAGADGIVMIEYTEKMDASTIEVYKPSAPGDYIIRRGEDVAADSVVLARGTVIGPYQMGLAAAVGYETIEVTERLHVGVISTGEELVEPAVVPKQGQVRDVNTFCLAGLIEKSGGIPTLYGIVRDDRTQLQDTLDKAIEENDLVIISGGSSIGVRDLTLEVLSEGLIFHGLAIRPGKPTLAAVVKNKLVMGLPGHPASAAIAFYLLVQPLLKWGTYQDGEQTVWAVLNRNLASGPGREDYVRVKLFSDHEKTVAVPVLGKSGLIHTLAEADGMIRIPLSKEGLCAGERVEVILF